jgi:hypothetical protein
VAGLSRAREGGKPFRPCAAQVTGLQGASAFAGTGISWRVRLLWLLLLPLRLLNLGLALLLFFLLLTFRLLNLGLMLLRLPLLLYRLRTLLNSLGRLR